MPKAQETAVYTHGHHESVLRSHTWRTAANSAAYLLGSLEPHLRILDVGCGPGTITADLAELVPDGHVTGVDRAPDVLERARATAAGRGLTGVDFAVADVHALDFPDDTFDVVHAHQVLQHVGDPGTGAARDGAGDAAGRAGRRPRRRLRRDDLVPGRTRPGRLAGAVPAGGPRQRGRAGRGPAAEGLGAAGGARRRHGHVEHLDLRHARGAGVVERPVGGPHPGVRLRPAGRRGRVRHRGAAAGRGRGLAGVGERRPTAGSACCTGRSCAARAAETALAGHSGGRRFAMVPILLVLLLVLVLFGAGFAVEVLWWIAVAVLVLWLLGFLLRGTTAGGTRGRWYRW
ncbi:hypothetical protein GCM10020295_14240 [Streptomyces cinereospinus]